MNLIKPAGTLWLLAGVVLVRTFTFKPAAGADLSAITVAPPIAGGPARLLLIGMGVWEYVSPGGNPRVGILHFETTRGDRLFISLLGSAFIHIAWLGFTNLNLWWAVALSLVYTVLVFRYV